LYGQLRHLAQSDWLAIGSAVFFFLANHWYSYRRTLARDQQGCPNIGTLMFLPYLRIIPMHLTIIFGNLSHLHGLFPLLLFGTLKTLADMAMHVVEKFIQASETPLYSQAEEKN
jgi:hypothetical protein